MDTRELTIGRLARRAGVNIETVRYYQRLGLIAEPLRPAQGFRRYPVAVASRIVFIKRAQRLGFRLREIRELLDLGDGRCADVRAIATAKRAQIADQIRDLEAMSATLDDLIRACSEGRDDAHCPIVEALTGKPRSPDDGSA